MLHELSVSDALKVYLQTDGSVVYKVDGELFTKEGLEEHIKQMPLELKLTHPSKFIREWANI